MTLIPLNSAAVEARRRHVKPGIHPVVTQAIFFALGIYGVAGAVIYWGFR